MIARARAPPPDRFCKRSAWGQSGGWGSCFVPGAKGGGPPPARPMRGSQAGRDAMKLLGITMRTARCGTCNESFFTMTPKSTEIEYCCPAHQGRVILRYDKMGHRP